MHEVAKRSTNPYPIGVHAPGPAGHLGLVDGMHAGAKLPVLEGVPGQEAGVVAGAPVGDAPRRLLVPAVALQSHAPDLAQKLAPIGAVRVGLKQGH